jgi:putative effector of murein hydrolase LrgA (UPF0299 family)
MTLQQSVTRESINYARFAVWLALSAGLTIGGVIGAGIAGLMHITIAGSTITLLMLWLALRLTRPAH